MTNLQESASHAQDMCKDGRVQTFRDFLNFMVGHSDGIMRAFEDMMDIEQLSDEEYDRFDAAHSDMIEVHVAAVKLARALDKANIPGMSFLNTEQHQPEVIPFTAEPNNGEK